MSHGCFISYKKEDKYYVELIANKLEELNISCSYLDKTIDSENIDAVISVLRNKYMNNKPVTLFLIGKHSYEDTELRWKNKYGNYYKHPEYNEQSFIIRELRATLSDCDGNPRHGIVGIVLPEMVNEIFKGIYKCSHCGQDVNYIALNDDTVVREFHENYYLTPISDECSHYVEDGRYCVLCKFDDFINNPEEYIDKAYDKFISKIANLVHFKDIPHDYKLRDE